MSAEDRELGVPVSTCEESPASLRVMLAASRLMPMTFGTTTLCLELVAAPLLPQAAAKIATGSNIIQHHHR
jgi:hypothetical protein